MLIVVALFVANGNAHAFADHMATKAEPCAAHHHHQDGDHRQCCCSCLDCPAGLISPVDEAGPHSLAHPVSLTPVRVSPLASRFLLPEPDPPRPDALS